MGRSVEIVAGDTIFYRLIKGTHIKHLDFFEQNLLINLETIFSLNWTNPKSHKN